VIVAVTKVNKEAKCFYHAGKPHQVYVSDPTLSESKQNSSAEVI